MLLQQNLIYTFFNTLAGKIDEKLIPSHRYVNNILISNYTKWTKSKYNDSQQLKMKLNH